MKDFVTEKEAAKKICPFIRVPFEEGAPKCIASLCMAWRWSHQDTGPSDPPTGFCGAAVLPKYI